MIEQLEIEKKLDRNRINQRCRCRGCGKLVLCPFCANLASNDLSQVTNTNKPELMFCSKSCRDKYYDRPKSKNRS